MSWLSTSTLHTKRKKRWDFYSVRSIQYAKLISTFFAHLFIGVLYGSLFSLQAKEYGLPQWFCIVIQLGTIALVTYVSYTEESRRYYPFSKVMAVNLLSLVLIIAVAMTKIYLLMIGAFAIVLFAIRYQCKKCVAYKRFKIG